MQKYSGMVSEHLGNLGTVLKSFKIDEKDIAAGSSLVCGLVTEYGMEILSGALLALVTAELGGAAGVAKAVIIAAKVKKLLARFKSVAKIAKMLRHTIENGSGKFDKVRDTYLSIVKNFQKIDEDDLELLAETDQKHFSEVGKWVLCSVGAVASRPQNASDNFFSSLFLKVAWALTPEQKCKGLSKAHKLMVTQSNKMKKIFKFSGRQDLADDFDNAITEVMGKSDRGYMRRCKQKNGKIFSDNWRKVSLDQVVMNCFQNAKGIKKIIHRNDKVIIQGESFSMFLDVSGSYFTVCSNDPMTKEPMGIMKADEIGPTKINDIRFRYLSVDSNCKKTIPPVDKDSIFLAGPLNTSAYKDTEEYLNRIYERGHFSLGKVPCY